jgi:UPF0176 protein
MKRDLRPRWEKQAAVASDGVARCTFSFYTYVRIEDPAQLQEDFSERLTALGCLGRMYIACEGINAQMSVPEQNWDAFDAYMKSTKECAVVPYKFAVEEGEAPSFFKLIVRVKKKIVADGLNDDTFDVTNTGEYLTAKEMNEYIEDPDAVVIDMRNIYESEVGHFQGAICPDVDTFKEELATTPQTLKIHENKKVALYCTGGIRCEKASAWLTHNGFADVKHLKGGVIDYKHQVEAEGLDNKFLGKNFVFDERMGEQIGEQVISTCHLCTKTKSDTHYHCKNTGCHILFLGCQRCIEKKKGFCSYKCLTLDKFPEKLKKRLVRNSFKNKKGYYKKYRMHSKFKIGT